MSGADVVVLLTVLRSGGDFDPSHVARIDEQFRRWAPGSPHLCLSDVDLPAGIQRHPLESDWPKWWAKIEAFRLKGPVLYFDLDTTICGDLSPLILAAGQHDFIALRDFNPHQREMGSGLMAWRGDMTRIYSTFSRDPLGAMRSCNTPRRWGDQGFIEPLTAGRAYWQSLLPGAVVSYKKHCRDGVPAGARVICHHGKPRPWEV